MNFGKNIKKRRKEKKITQQVLATKCNIAISTLQKIENNKHANPSLDILLALSKELEISLDALLGNK